MANELATVAPTSMTELVKFGEYVSKDKYGVVAKMGAAQAYGFHPALYNDVIYLMDIRGEKTWGLSTKAIGALIQRHPKYDYTPITKEAGKCVIRFYKKSEMTGEIETHDETLTREQADKAGYPHTKKGEKETWTKYPEQMLFYRCLAIGARTFCPEVLGGGNAYDVDEIPGARIVSDAEVEVLEVIPNVPPVETKPEPVVEVVPEEEVVVKTRPVLDDQTSKAVQWCKGVAAGDIINSNSPEKTDQLANRALTRVLGYHSLNENNVEFIDRWTELSPMGKVCAVVTIFNSGDLASIGKAGEPYVTEIK